MNAVATIRLATVTGIPPSDFADRTSGHHATAPMNAAWLTIESPTTSQMNPSHRRCDTRWSLTCATPSGKTKHLRYSRAVRTPSMDAASMSRVIRRLRRAAPTWDTTALMAVSEASGQDPFRILVACILSLRTKDETTGPAAARLFALGDTPAAIFALTTRQIERAIYPVGFYRTKARGLRRLCRDLIDRFDGRVPSDLDALLTLHGVGRKTANLVVTFGFGLPGICVDTHVHRITNRFGFVRTRSPEETEMALRARLPKRHWIELNDLLVAFGRNTCHPTSPRCSACPVAADCRRIGVSRSR